MAHEAVNTDSKKIWQARKPGKRKFVLNVLGTVDFYCVDGGEAGAEDERATQARATITKNAAHLK